MSDVFSVIGLAVVACILFAGGVITGIALCVWASKTRIHEPLQ